MGSYTNPVPQYLDDAGNVLAQGELHFFITGTNTRLDTFKDANLTLPNTNPVELGASGRPKYGIWLSGLYKVILTAQGGDPLDTGQQIWVRDPVGDADQTIPFDQWIPTGVYGVGSIVTYEGIKYESIEVNNIGNTPDSSTSWTRIDFIYTYNAEQTYLEDHLARDGSYIYRSLTDNNLNKKPSESPDEWEHLGIRNYVSTDFYNIGGRTYGADNIEYISAVDGNTNNTPNESPDEWRPVDPRPWVSADVYNTDDVTQGSNGLFYVSLGDGNTTNDPVSDGFVNWGVSSDVIVPASDYTLVSTQNITTTTASVTFSEEFDFTEYLKMIIKFDGIEGDTASILELTLRDNTDTEITAGYEYGLVRSSSQASSVITDFGNNTSNIPLTESQQLVGTLASGTIEIAGDQPHLDIKVSYVRTTTYIDTLDGSASIEPETTPTETTGFTLQYASGNLEGGTISLYGVRR